MALIDTVYPSLLSTKRYVFVLGVAGSRVRLHAGKDEHRSHGQRAHHGQHGEQDTVVVGELLDHATDGSAEAAGELEDGVEHAIERRGGLGKACELEGVET